MRGTVVIAKDFAGAALVRRVWEVGDGLVYLSTEPEFAKLEAGNEALPPIGFPANDVFVYEGQIGNGKAKPDWSRLQQWKPIQAV